MESAPNDMNHALGRLPSGIYILTARDASGTRSTGMLASWVQQAGFQPPMLTVAIGVDRYIRSWLRETGRFTLNQIASGHKPLVKHFGRGFGPDDPAFDGLKLLADPGIDAPPILAEAMAYLIVDVRGELIGQDHAIVLGEVVGGALLTDEEPMVHVRKIGSHY
jgi:flavin reductase (DIM6/NTAB) family NADH-FMN oxidoreductase RutF